MVAFFKELLSLNYQAVDKEDRDLSENEWEKR